MIAEDQQQLTNRPISGFALCCFAVGLVACLSQPARAAELSSACCGDLQQRIAELDELTVRRMTPNFEVKVSGSINHAILFWDDGAAKGASVVTNDNDNSTVTIEGESLEGELGWSAGFVMDFDIVSAGSSDVDQRQLQGRATIQPGELSVWIKNERLGQLSVGRTSAKGASSGSNEADLSGTEVAAYSSVTDIGGAFLLRRSGAAGSRALTSVNWDRIIDSLDEPDGNVITYSSPVFGGLSASGLWGEDDVWNIGLGYANESSGPFRVVARAALNEDLQGRQDGAPNDRTLGGSIAVLHKPSGLNFAIAGGNRQYLEPMATNTGLLKTPQSPSFGYLKAGWRAAVNSAGTTDFYAEYGRFRNFLGANADAETVASLAADNTASICSGAGAACFVSSSDASVWGAGVVQHIESANAQLYLGYRHFEAEVGLSGVRAGRINAAPLSSFDTLISGLLIEF